MTVDSDEIGRRWRALGWGKARGGRAAPVGVLGSTGDGRRRRVRGGGWPAAALRHGGGFSGGEGMGWPGLGAARERGGARGGVCAGGAAVEERGDGELKLAGVRVGGGGVLEIWSGEVARE